MKTIKKKFLLAFGVALFVTHNLNAQVTIGSELEPNAGSLLDLKESSSLGVNSSKGFNLPRVALTSLSSLDPCAADTDTNKKSHTGLTVYNTATSGGLKAGTYVWDGTSWIPSKDRAKRVDATLTQLGVTALPIGQLANVASFAIPESGWYALNLHVRCNRESTTTSHYYSYITGTNYSYCFAIGYATENQYEPLQIFSDRTYVDYLEAGAYYITVLGEGIVWNYITSSLSLVKLSD